MNYLSEIVFIGSLFNPDPLVFLEVVVFGIISFEDRDDFFDGYNLYKVPIFEL